LSLFPLTIKWLCWV